MKIFCFLLMFLISSCTIVEAGKVREERQRLYDYNNDEEYCNKNPSRCVNGIPW